MSGAPEESSPGAVSKLENHVIVLGYNLLGIYAVERLKRMDIPYVVVVRDETAATRRQVGIGLGDLDHCADSLTFAFEEAGLRQASVLAIHAWHAPQADISRAGDTFTAAGPHDLEAEAARQLEALLNEWRAKYPDVPVSHDVVHGHPGRALVGLSARADLVVIGRHAKHPGLQGPGSVRHAVLNHAHGPVAVVPS